MSGFVGYLGLVSCYAAVALPLLFIGRSFILSLAHFDRRSWLQLVLLQGVFHSFYGGFDSKPAWEEFSPAAQRFLNSSTCTESAHPIKHAIETGTGGEVVVFTFTRYKAPHSAPDYTAKSDYSSLILDVDPSDPRGGRASTVVGARKRAAELLAALDPSNMGSIIEGAGGAWKIFTNGILGLGGSNRGVAAIDPLHPHFELTWIATLFDRAEGSQRQLITWSRGYRSTRKWDAIRVYRFQSVRSYLELLLHPHVMEAFRHEHAATEDFLVMLQDGSMLGWICRGLVLVIHVLSLNVLEQPSRRRQPAEDVSDTRRESDETSAPADELPAIPMEPKATRGRSFSETALAQ